MRTSWRTAEVPKDKKVEEELIIYLRDNNYPKPVDCIGNFCKEYRPSCALGICFMATLICKDF